MVSRTVRKEGEVIPGPLEQAEISTQGDLLQFQKMRFARDKQLDNDLLAIYQGESGVSRVRSATDFFSRHSDVECSFNNATCSPICLNTLHHYVHRYLCRTRTTRYCQSCRPVEESAKVRRTSSTSSSLVGLWLGRLQLFIRFFRPCASQDAIPSLRVRVVLLQTRPRAANLGYGQIRWPSRFSHIYGMFPLRA